MLVFAFLSRPHRIEPICARAYCCVLDFSHFIHAQPHRIEQRCAFTSSQTGPKHGLMTQVRNALATFRLGLTKDLELSFANMTIPILHIGVKDITQL